MVQVFRSRIWNLWLTFAVVGLAWPAVAADRLILAEEFTNVG